MKVYHSPSWSRIKTWLVAFMAVCCVPLLLGGCPSQSGTTPPGMDPAPGDDTTPGNDPTPVVDDGDKFEFPGGNILQVPADATFEPDRQAAEDAEELLSDLPKPDAGYLTQDLEGPEGMAFGPVLDDLTQLYLLAEPDGPGVKFNGVLVGDLLGNIILRQDLYVDGSRLTFATGDAVDFVDDGDGAKITLLLNATTPPSTVVLHVDGDENVSVDMDASFFADEVNEDYNESKIDLTRACGTKGLIRQQSSLPARTGINPPVPIGAEDPCDKALGSLLAVADIACDWKDITTKKLPLKVIQGICAGTEQGLNLAKGQSETGVRVVAAIKGSLTMVCKGMEYGIAGASVFNPWGLACLAMDATEEAVQVGSGQTIAQNICDEFQDADEDGIDDSEDPCPDTVKGEAADENGCSECQRDFDDDTVVDCLDLCPTLKDQSNADDDGDGVGNICDECDDTPEGETVDDVGCSDVQNIGDDDNDGVPNDVDLCPHTISPDNEDPDGDFIANPCDNCDSVANPDQEDTNNDGVGDACDGTFTIIAMQPTGNTPLSAMVTISGDPQYPTLSFNYAEAHAAWIAEDVTEGEFLWGFTTFEEECSPEPCLPEPSSVSSPLTYGQYKSPSEPFEDTPDPSPPLEKGKVYTASVLFFIEDDFTTNDSIFVVFKVNE